MSASRRAAACLLLAACAGAAATTDEPHVELALPAADVAWSPDGRFVAFLGKEDAALDWRRGDVVTVVEAQHGASFTIEAANAFQFLPDGAHVAYVSGTQLHVLDTATAAPVFAAPINTPYRALPDGRIAWGAVDGAVYHVHVRDLRTGTDQLLEGLPHDPRTVHVTLFFDHDGHLWAGTEDRGGNALDVRGWLDPARPITMNALPPEPSEPDVPRGSDAEPPSPGEHLAVAPDHATYAGTIDDRPTIWAPGGAIRWQGPAVSAVAHLAFAPDGSLVLANDGVTVWHLDLATERLHIGTLARCADGIAAFAVGADGVAAAVCPLSDGGASIVIEDDPRAAATTTGPVRGVAASRAGFVWSVGTNVTEYELPGGTKRWSVNLVARPRALTDDGRAFAGAENQDGDTEVQLRDAPDHLLALHVGPGRPIDLRYSPDGARFAALLDGGRFYVLAAETGTTEDLVYAPASSIAWDPFGRRIAYYRGRSSELDDRDMPDEIGIWNLATHTPEEHVIAAPPMSPVTQLAWSPDGAYIAGLANGRVLVWNATRLGDPPREFALTGGGGVAIHADGTATLLADPAAGRSLVRCVAGRLTVPAPRCFRR